MIKINNENFEKNYDNLISIKDEEIRKLKEKCKILYEEKMKIIEDAKLNNTSYGSRNYTELSKGEKTVAINFISEDHKINHSIICKNKTKFCELESNFHEKFPEYLENDISFIFNGLKINRWKTFEDNGINGYTIMVKNNNNE